MSYKAEFIAFMARAGVLTFGDFTTKSGRKTPYFINTGNYRTGAQIARLGEFYAACIAAHTESGELPSEVAALFGPAYKGIPLAVSTAAALARMGRDVNYCFNRKEAKDHGEGGSMVGYQPKDGDKLLIIEDVITAGTAVRETLPVLHAAARVEVPGLIISVDRMERGQGELTAIEEIERDFGIRTFPLVTVRDILETLYNKEIDGRILIDGRDYRERSQLWLHSSIGYVLQTPHLFSGSIRENIRYGRLDATDEECMEAAKIANAHYFISHLPQGYDTVLYSDGANLSQGQRQLVAIARAAVSRAPVLILDEATSSVDTRTEKLIGQGLDGLMAGRTVFVIAHRLSTVRNANAIMVLDHGRIVERGDHDDLIRQHGLYYQLYTGAFELE